MNTPQEQPPVAPAASPAPPAPVKVNKKEWMVPLIAVTLVLILILYAAGNWNFWVSSGKIQTTNNASVKADLTLLNTKVSGYVKRIAVEDFQTVKAGDLIAELNDEDYRAAELQAKANVESAKATLASLSKELLLQESAISQAEANRDSVQAKLTLAQHEVQRYQTLKQTNAVSQNDLDTKLSQYHSYLADSKYSASTVEYQKRQLEVLSAERAKREANLKAAEAQLLSAKIKLDDTRILAPVDGVIGKRRVYNGSYVAVGSQITSLVPASDVYIIANYKEIQLANVRPGQPVEIEVDTFSGQKLKGIVNRIAPASGSEYAVLPADNATGNFTKVVQRIPVRITLLPGQDILPLLLPGMSAVTSIDTSKH